MSITSFPPITGIFPTTVNEAFLNQNPVVQNTFYTVLDLTSGKGCLTEVSARFGSAVDKVVEFKITIDGTETTFDKRNHYQYAPTGGNTEQFIFRFKTLVYFRSSLKVEVANTSDTTNFTAAVNYSTV